MLPSMNCSVKSLEPTTIVGPLEPPEPELSVPPMLPQETMSSNDSPTTSAGTARISFVLFFIFPPLSFVPSATPLLRYLEPFRGKRPLQRAEPDLRDDREDRDGDGPGEQDFGSPARVAFHDQISQAPAAYKRCEGGACDRLHGRGSDAREDHGRGYRQLDAGQDLAPRKPHSAGGVDDVLVDLPKPRGGVDEDRRNGQRRESD